MPYYEYHCDEHGRFTVRQPMFDKHEANCACGKPAERRFSVARIRSAEPLTVLQDLGKRDGQHLGYQKVDWIADSGIFPGRDQPYKTPEQVAKEEYGGLIEV